MASNFTLQDCLVKIYTQPCWDCKKACGGCCWSAKFEPIPSWDAAKRKLSHNSSSNATTYAIKFCPEFEPEVAR